MTFEKLRLRCLTSFALITAAAVSPNSLLAIVLQDQSKLPPMVIESTPFKTNRITTELDQPTSHPKLASNPFQPAGFKVVSQPVESFAPADINNDALRQNPEFMELKSLGDSFFEQPQTCSPCITVKKNPLGCLEDIAVLPQDEVWLINARNCVCGETDVQLLDVSKLDQSSFARSSMTELSQSHDADLEKVTVMYIHGNQTNLEFAISRGMQVYRNAFYKQGECRQPVRFVIWAWKSEQEKTRLYPDYLVKSNRSVMLGDTFASTLNQFSNRRMLVFGYSLGVQVALSAFDSPLLQSNGNDASRYHVAFAAPAINADYVASHALSQGGLTPISQTFVFTNRKDRAIRAAQAIIRRKSLIDKPSVEGLSRAGKLDVGAICTVEISDEAGPFHSVERYTRSSKLQLTMAALVNTVASSAKTSTAEIAALPEKSTLHRKCK